MSIIDFWVKTVTTDGLIGKNGNKDYEKHIAFFGENAHRPYAGKNCDEDYENI